MHDFFQCKCLNSNPWLSITLTREFWVNELGHLSNAFSKQLRILFQVESMSNYCETFNMMLIQLSNLLLIAVHAGDLLYGLNDKYLDHF